MPILKLWQTGVSREISFTGTPALSELLRRHNIAAAQPCGGRGVCGKCAVRANGAVSPPTPSKKKAGTRLSCQITLLGDAEIWLQEDSAAVETAGYAPVPGTAMAGQFGAFTWSSFPFSRMPSSKALTPFWWV